MPQREIRYCTTEDGVRIAYCVEGHGPTTILALPCYVESFALDHLMPVYQQFYRDLGDGRRIVRLDWRDTGLSADASASAAPATVVERIADVKAVASALGSKITVWASTVAGPPAIEFAIAHPDAVTSLIFYDTFADRHRDVSRSAHDALVELARTNWDLAAQTIADTNGRREFPEEAAQLGEWYFRSMSGDRFVALMTQYGPRVVDEIHDLSRVAVPTLVMHRIADPIISFAAGQKLAAGIPNALFVPLEGKGHLFCLGDYGNILSAVDNFLGDRVGATPEPTTARSVRTERRGGVSTVLFTDIVGHTEMMQRLGDAKGRDVLREHERITRETLKAHGGAEVKTMGDGFLASFGSVTSAMECAIALQRAFAAHEGEPLHVRVGLNAGEPIEEDGDLFGATVILASRIAAKAGAGEILIPEPVRHLLAGKTFTFSDRGEYEMKGFDDAVRLYEVKWRETLDEFELGSVRNN